MSEPVPPLNYVSPNNYENRWKISPSLLGGLRGQMKMYGMTYESCLAYIWQSSQPDYFHQCLKNHGYEDFEGSLPRTTTNWLKIRLTPGTNAGRQSQMVVQNEINSAINARSSVMRGFHISNAYAGAQLGCLTRQEQYNPLVVDKYMPIIKEEINRSVYTQSGTLGEEADIIALFKHNNLLSSMKRGELNMFKHPTYWNDNKGSSLYPTPNTKISHNSQIKCDEYFHKLLWNGTPGKWGAILWGKLDGVLYGKCTNGNVFYDVFEAKQRQSKDSMCYPLGKASEITQMHIYMMMLESEKQMKFPRWRWKDLPANNEKTGAWLLQTQWNSSDNKGKRKQTLEFISWNQNEINTIKEVLNKACNDLWNLQAYKFRTNTDSYNKSIQMQKEILKSVAWKN